MTDRTFACSLFHPFIHPSIHSLIHSIVRARLIRFRNRSRCRWSASPPVTNCVGLLKIRVCSCLFVFTTRCLSSSCARSMYLVCNPATTCSPTCLNIRAHFASESLRQLLSMMSTTVLTSAQKTESIATEPRSYIATYLPSLLATEEGRQRPKNPERANGQTRTWRNVYSKPGLFFLSDDHSLDRSVSLGRASDTNGTNRRGMRGENEREISFAAANDDAGLPSSRSNLPPNTRPAFRLLRQRYKLCTSAAGCSSGSSCARTVLAVDSASEFLRRR